MFVELHLIQNFVPSNLNRDDTNNPKDCEFGGQRRARISSQSLKRAIRYEPVFKKTTQAQIGERTKRVMRLLGEPLLGKGKAQDEVEAIIGDFATAYLGKGSKVDVGNFTTNNLFYVSTEERTLMLQTLLENWEELAQNSKERKSFLTKLVKEKFIKETKGVHAPDIALFGRMLAGQPALNIDAACQVSHAISTHRIKMEMDYFTAVDDLLKADEEVGAGMVGFTSFNSACFYRYARLDWQQLVKNLNDDVALAHRTVEGFLRAALDAIPTGKQNSFAAQNPTSLAMAVVRDDGQSWNLANAFEKTVYPHRGSGLIEPSIQALDKFWGNLHRTRDDAEFKAIAIYTDQYQDTLDSLQPYLQTNLSNWINAINTVLPQE